MDEIKNKLGDIAISEEIVTKLSRQASRQAKISESGSDAGSERANGSLRHQNSIDSGKLKTGSMNLVNDKKEKVGEKLIEAEKSETGGVKWDVYKHYLKSIGFSLTFATLFLNLIFQGFSIGSNLWLSRWSSDSAIVVNGTTDTARRDMYLGVYGALGFGQGMF